MVILRRADGQEDFNRYYDEFEDGFGELDRDFFYGLKALNELTACDNWAPQTNWVLRIDFYNNSNDTESSAHATYNNFTIGCKDEGYPLQLGKFEPSEPTLRDNLSEFEKQKFVALKPFEARPTCLSGGNSGAWWYKEDKCKSSFGSVLTVPYQHLGWYEYEQDNRERNYGKYELKIRRENCLSSINSSQ